MFRQACANLEHLEMRDPGFRRQCFVEEDSNGYKATRPFRLMEEAEFVSKYGVRFKDVASALPIDTVYDERGQKAVGILIATGPTVYEMYNMVQTAYGETIHDPGMQLRVDQGKEVAAFYRTDLSKVEPRGQSKGKSITMDDVAAVAQRVQDAIRVEAEQRALQAAPSSLAEEPVAQQEGERQESDEEIVFEGDLPEQAGPAFVGPSEGKKRRGSVGGSKGKGKGKNKNNGSAKRRCVAQSGAESVVGALPSACESRAESIADSGEPLSQRGGGGGGSVKTMLSPGEKAEQACYAHIAALKVEKLLAGEALGRELWQAQRALAAMSKGEPTVAAVLLRGHVDFWKRCEKLLPATIHKVPKLERESIVQEITESNVQIPPLTRASLLAAASKELPLSARVACLNPFASSIDAAGAPIAFDAKKPQRVNSSLPDTEAGKLLQRLLVSEGIVPAIVKGQGETEQVKAACSAILAWTTTPQPSLSPILACAVDEVQSVARCLYSILSDDTTASVDSGVQTLLESTKGARMIVKQACGRCKRTGTGPVPGPAHREEHISMIGGGGPH